MSPARQMPRFVVRIGYDWVTPCYREIEVDAADATDAGEKALALSKSDPEFWTQFVECDGESTATSIIEIEEA
jgi:hypothetical protein